MRAPSLLLLPLLGSAVACGGGSPGPAQRFWSMAELKRESHLDQCDNPAGLACTYFIAPGMVGTDVVQFKLAFSQGQPMGYMTTDFWANYDRIWLQPLYLLVTAWNENAPLANRLRDSNDQLVGPIFSVGAQSAFYSPFWSVFYVVVPEGTPPGKYTATRQLFEEHLEMHQGVNRFASIAPDGVALPDQQELLFQFQHFADYLKDPNQVGEVIKRSQTLSGWIDGATVKYVDFGTDNFAVDAAGVIQDVPLFVFMHRDPTPGTDGALTFLGSPNVGGIGPLFSGAPLRITAQGRPQIGALWRLYLVTVPATADFLTRKRITGSDDPDAPVPAGLQDKILRVALNASTCFDHLIAGNDDCVWLDSQAAIEQNVGPSGIARTALQPACPFVMFNGVPVPYP